MKSKILILVFGLALCIISGCEVLDDNPEEQLELENTPTEMADMSIPQLIARVHEASDPKHVWRDSTSYILRQSVREEEKKEKSTIEHYFRTEIKFRQPRQLRQTSSKDNAPFQVLLYKDEQGWAIDRNGSAEKMRPDTGLKLFRNYIGFSDPKVVESDLFPTIELAVVYLEGKRTYRMICRSSDVKISPYVKYIDAETFLPVKEETVIHVQDGRKLFYRSEPMDFKWVNNVKIPLRTIVTVGDKTEEFVTDEFIINPPIPDEDFELPKSAEIDYKKSK